MLFTLTIFDNSYNKYRMIHYQFTIPYVTQWNSSTLERNSLSDD